MKKLALLLFIATTAIAACSDASKTKSENTQVAKTLVVASADAAEKYQCPMKCQGDTAYTTAGQCPVCEMNLEKLN